jgi:hypothetical protein
MRYCDAFGAVPSNWIVIYYKACVNNKSNGTGSNVDCDCVP